MEQSLENIGRGLIGIAFLVGVCYLFSNNRKAIDWKLVITGILLQIVFAVLVLYVDIFRLMIDGLSNFFVAIIDCTNAGSEFLFGKLATDTSYGAIFAFKILPTIVFFSALSSLLYYLGILQKIVYGLAWIMSRTMRLSGSESLNAAGNIFLGQTESPLLIKPFLSGMTKSELLCVMVGGMATIAGGVLTAYIGFLGGDDKAQQIEFAKHLLSASIMSAPAAIVAAKMLFPQMHKDINRKLELNKEKIGKNALEAVAMGTTDGLKLAVNVGAMLIVFTAFMYMFNLFLMNFGSWIHVNERIATYTHNQYDGLSLTFLFGYLFSPVAWLIGVPSSDLLSVGQLIGEKTVLNEFYAYKTLGEMKFGGALTDQKSIIIATYALCGFSNFASIGIQIGGIGALAPNQRTALSQLGLRALLGGTIACLFTAAIAGMLISQ